MKNIILAIDRVEPGLVEACREIEKKLGYKIEGIRLVSEEYKHMQDTTYTPDTSGFFNEITVDYDDKKQLQKFFKEIKDRILAVNCRDEGSIPSLSKVIPFIPNVPTPNETTLKWATEKNLMRDMMYYYDESLVPAYIEIPREKIDSSTEQLKKMRLPVIVKPCGLNTSMLVKKCYNLEELLTYLHNTYEIIDDVYELRGGNGSPKLLVEEFMSGNMYSIDAYVKPDGNDILCLPPVRVITAHEAGLNGFYGYERILPSELNTEDTEIAIQTATKAIKALNLRSCTAHVEMYKTNNGWKIIEVGPRIGGNRDLMYKLAYGISHYYNDLASRIEELEFEITTDPIAYVTCINEYPEKEGKVTKITGLEEARNLATNIYVRQALDVGDNALKAENGGLYFAAAVFSGKDKDQVINDTKTAHSLIKIEVE